MTFVFVSDSSPSAEEVTATDWVDANCDAIELAVDPFSPRVVNPRHWPSLDPGRVPLKNFLCANFKYWYHAHKFTRELVAKPIFAVCCMCCGVSVYKVNGDINLKDMLKASGHNPA